MIGLYKTLLSKVSLVSFGAVVVLSFLGCGGGSDVAPAPNRPPPPKAVQKEAPKTPEETAENEEEEESPVYVYGGSRFRNPFIPAGQSSTYKPDAIFNPEQAAVKAIIHSKKMRSAVVNVRGSGSYFINAGRIFDIMGKTVKGYSARVFPTRVLILGGEGSYELKIRDQNEGEKT